MLKFELLRSNHSNELANEITKQGLKLSMTMALDQDSSAFNNFFLDQVLPRYSRVLHPGVLNRISETFELAEETSEFLYQVRSEAVKINDNTEIFNHLVKQEVKSEVVKSATTLSIKDKKINVQRNLASGLKKQVNVKSVKRVLSLTPKQNEDQISYEAKKLKDYNQEYFYKKRENEMAYKELKDKEMFLRDEIKESEGDVLVLRTPTKGDEEPEEELWLFKSVFQV